MGAEIHLTGANGSPLLGANTSGGTTLHIPGGATAASVHARFFSTTAQPLRAGTYTASIVISVVAD